MGQWPPAPGQEISSHRKVIDNNFCHASWCKLIDSNFCHASWCIPKPQANGLKNYPSYVLLVMSFSDLLASTRRPLTPTYSMGIFGEPFSSALGRESQTTTARGMRASFAMISAEKDSSWSSFRGNHDMPCYVLPGWSSLVSISAFFGGCLVWEVLNGVDVDGVGELLPFFSFFFFFFFFFVFLRFFVFCGGEGFFVFLVFFSFFLFFSRFSSLFSQVQFAGK